MFKSLLVAVAFAVLSAPAFSADLPSCVRVSHDVVKVEKTASGDYVPVYSCRVDINA